MERMKKYLPKISVVIPAYKDFDLLKILLERIFQTKYKNFEVLVIDDASPEDLSGLRKLFPIRYFRNKKNLGVAEARTIGAKKAKGEIILSLDNDVKPFADLIYEVYRFFKKNPGVVAVTGFPGTGAENPAFFAKYKFMRDRAYWYLEADKSKFYYFRPAIGAIKRKVFMELKGYDSRFCKPGVPAVEDLEFSYRLAKKGKIVFDPKLVVGHPFGGLRKLMKTYFQRAALFLEVIREKRYFSGVATTKGEAATILLANLSLFSLLVLPFFFPWLVVFGVSLYLFAYRQRKFLRYCLTKEGLLFAFGAFLTSWLLYLVITAGGVWAVGELTKMKIFKIKRF